MLHITNDLVSIQNRQAYLCNLHLILHCFKLSIDPRLVIFAYLRVCEKVSCFRLRQYGNPTLGWCIGRHKRCMHWGPEYAGPLPAITNERTNDLRLETQ